MADKQRLLKTVGKTEGVKLGRKWRMSQGPRYLRHPSGSPNAPLGRWHRATVGWGSPPRPWTFSSNITCIYCRGLCHVCVAMLRQSSTRGFQLGSNLSQNTDFSFPSTSGREICRCLRRKWRKCCNKIHTTIQFLSSVQLSRAVTLFSVCKKMLYIFIYSRQASRALLSCYWFASVDTGDRSTSERYANKI